MLEDNGYEIKILNTTNFKKSMKYNPFAYLRSEKDILKLVQTIIANTKGEGEKAGEDFWIKAEKLYYTALISYIFYEAPREEKNFATLLDMIDAWMPMEKWDACSFEVNEDELEGRVCYGGLDLSSATDITAFVLIFSPVDEEDKFIVLPYFWLPEDTLDLRVKCDHVPYDIWERQGFIQTTEGNVVHYGYIETFIEKLGERFNIREIAFDRWGAVQMVQNLENMGFTVVPFGQGFKDMSPPTKELMKLTLEQKFTYGGNPVLRWMMDNIFIRTNPAGNIKADKEKSTEKIDGTILPLSWHWIEQFDVEIQIPKVSMILVAFYLCRIFP